MNKALPSQSLHSNDSNPLGTTVTQTYVDNPASLWWFQFSLCIHKHMKSSHKIKLVCTVYKLWKSPFPEVKRYAINWNKVNYNTHSSKLKHIFLNNQRTLNEKKSLHHHPPPPTLPKKRKVFTWEGFVTWWRNSAPVWSSPPGTVQGQPLTLPCQDWRFQLQPVTYTSTCTK